MSDRAYYVLVILWLIWLLVASAELPKDRKHCAILLRWTYAHRWREAVAAGDPEAMKRADRIQRMAESL